MAQHILITGGTGFIGRPLCRTLLAQGHSVTVLSRQPGERVSFLCGAVKAIRHFDEIPGLPPLNAAINLAGEPIANRRWSPARKVRLRDSRILFTHQLVSRLVQCSQGPEVLISGSAVGFYGDQGDQLVTEETAPHDEFTHQLCRDWENAALDASKGEIRVCLARTGLVVGAQGGFLQRMLPIFRLGLGGPFGNGQQFMPWIHREDHINALIWLMQTGSAAGAYNLTAPEPVTNLEFTRALAMALQRPARLSTPAFALRLALGEMARLLLTGQRAIPQRLQQQGFQFRHPSLEASLREVVAVH